MNFETIVGNQKAKNYFKTSIKNSQIPHAILLTGKNGIGKLAFAQALAQTLNCESPTETNDACGKCRSCTKINNFIHPDIHYILPVFSKKVSGEGGSSQATSADFFDTFRDKFSQNPYYVFDEWLMDLDAGNKQFTIYIDEIRQLKKKVLLKNFEAKYKVAILWNADKLNMQAANALLKILEEPPKNTVFVLIAENTTRLLPTIISRCQNTKLSLISSKEIADQLIGSQNLPQKEAAKIAFISEGSYARALQLANNTDHSVIEEFQNWMRLCYSGKLGEIKVWMEGIEKRSKEFQKLFLKFGLQKMHDSLAFKMNADELALVYSDDDREFTEKFSKFMSFRMIEKIADEFEKSIAYLSRNANTTMVFWVLSINLHDIFRKKR